MGSTTTKDSGSKGRSKKGGAGRGGSGVKPLGVRDGERWWEARLVWTDPRTGEKHDTQATYAAPSKLVAMQERARRIKAEKQRAAGYRRLRFGEVLDEWLATLECFSTEYSWRSHANRIRRHFGNWWIDTITTRDMQAWLSAQKRLDGKPLGKGTANSIRDVLVKTWQHAVEHGYVENAEVARGTLRRKSGRTRADALAELEEEEEKRSFSAEEAVSVLTDLQKHDPEIYPLMLVQFILGCRFAESSALRRDCLDMQTGVAFIAWGQVRGRLGPTKGKRRRKAALGPVGMKVVQEHLRRMDELKWPGHEELVFPRPPHRQARAISRATGKPVSFSAHWSYTAVTQKLRACFERLGLNMANTTHAARHTMNNLASQNLARAHLSESLLRKVVGHSSAQISAVYRHPEHAEVIQLAEVVEGGLFGERTKRRKRSK